MINFLFWNVNKKPLEHLIKELAFQHNVDVIMLAEFKTNSARFLQLLNKEKFQYFYNESLCEKIHVFSKFRDDFFPKFSESGRYTIRHLKLPGLDDILLAVAHFPSKMNFNDESQAVECDLLAGFIQDAETRIGHSRTILVGDLNMNPFEKGMVKTTGLHSVMSQQIAQKGSRTVQGRDYKFFYNPMWNFLGDFAPYPAGTHYYHASEHIAYFWNMFDQVLVRPELLNIFSNDDLKIIDSIGDKTLLNENGLPNTDLASDHLPILFSLRL